MLYKLSILFLTILIISIPSLSNIQNLNYLTEKALTTASLELDYLLSEDPVGTMWDLGSYITDAYPVYLPGYEEPSYFECKVMYNSQDAGYILVNIDKTDVPVAEYRVEGKTHFELFEQSLGHSHFKTIRIDWIQWLAMDNDKIIASQGFESSSSDGLIKKLPIQNDNSYEYSVYDTLKQMIDSTECVPLFSKEYLDYVYQNNPDLTGLNKATGKGPTDHAKLKNKFSSINWRTAAWNQGENAEGNKVGCGPVAWAIVFSYWHQFHNKPNLFDNVDLNGKVPNEIHSYCSQLGRKSSEVTNSINRIARLTDTWQTENWGWTTRGNMENGIDYASEKGYSYSFNTTDNGGDKSTYYTIRDAISRDKPAILSIHVNRKDRRPEEGLPNHWVVVEETKCHKHKKPISGNYYTRWIEYYINLGWGKSSGGVWIRVYDFGKDQKERTSSFCTIIPNVRNSVVKDDSFDFEVSKTRSIAPCEVTLSPQGSILPFTNVFFWEWDFGDGQISNEKNPTHTYEKPGKYDISLTMYGLYQFGWISESVHFFKYKSINIGTLDPIINLLLD